VIARGELGHHPAEGPVQIDLTDEFVREQPAMLVEHGDRAFIAGGFDGKYAQFLPFAPGLFRIPAPISFGS
jgi:hypothetical protein